MGYDYWPNFCILINFIGFGYYLKKKNNQILLLTGLSTAITIWFRSITTFFPFFVALVVLYYYKKEPLRHKKFKNDYDLLFSTSNYFDFNIIYI